MDAVNRHLQGQSSYFIAYLSWQGQLDVNPNVTDTLSAHFNRKKAPFFSFMELTQIFVSLTGN